MSTFPSSPVVDQLFITPSGRGYRWTVDGAWVVVQVPELTTAQRDSLITRPKSGRLISNTTNNQLEQWNGSVWDPVGATGGGPPTTFSGSVSPSVVTLTNGTPVNVTFTTTGSTSPYTYSVISGTLPAGLTLSSGGTLSGTPSATGAYAFTIRVTSATSETFDFSLSGSLGAGPFSGVISPSVLSITQGASVSITFTTSGGTGPYIYTVSEGSMPAGLTLTSGGSLTGTPTSASAYNFTVTVTDAIGRVYSQIFAGSVATGFFNGTISPSVISLVQTVPFDRTLSVSGGTAPYSFAMTPGDTLPTGLTLDSSGRISGTPTNSGSYSFSIRATDAASLVFDSVFTGNIVAFSGTLLENAYAGSTFDGSVTANGQVVYYDSSANLWRLARASQIATQAATVFGVARLDINGVYLDGSTIPVGDLAVPALSDGDIGYVSDNGGAPVATPGSYQITIGNMSGGSFNVSIALPAFTGTPIDSIYSGSTFDGSVATGDVVYYESGSNRWLLAQSSMPATQVATIFGIARVDRAGVYRQTDTIVFGDPAFPNGVGDLQTGYIASVGGPPVPGAPTYAIVVGSRSGSNFNVTFTKPAFSGTAIETIHAGSTFDSSVQTGFVVYYDAGTNKWNPAVSTNAATRLATEFGIARVDVAGVYVNSDTIASSDPAYPSTASAGTVYVPSSAGAPTSFPPASVIEVGLVDLSGLALSFVKQLTFTGSITPSTINLTNGTPETITLTTSTTSGTSPFSYTLFAGSLPAGMTLASAGPQTVTMAVTVSSFNEGNRYLIDGVKTPNLTLREGDTIVFDLSDASNATHPLRLSMTPDGTHGGGGEYTNGVVINGTPGSAGANLTFTVPADAPAILYYYCVNHSGMAGSAAIQVVEPTTNDTLSGTPSVTGTFNVTIRATDASSATLDQAVAITVS